jgi:hypothetical protein
MKKLLILLALWAGMAWGQGVPISTLPAASTSTNGVEVFPVVQSAVTKKMSLAQVVAYLLSQNNSWGALNTFSTTNITGVLTVGTMTANLFGTYAAEFGPAATNSFTGVFFFNAVPHYSNIVETDPGYPSAWLASGPVGEGFFIAPSAGIPFCLGSNNTADLCFTGTTITVPGATSVPWPKVAYGSINGISGCIIDSAVASIGIASCTHLATGSYTVSLSSSVGFTTPPACTVTAGSGSGGGSNANSVQSATVALSGSTYVISILAFNVSIVAQDNHFMITCMGT